MLSLFAGSAWTPCAALAQQPIADCDGWMSNAEWSRRGVFVEATATLEQLQNGVFVAVDTSHASRFASQGGEVLLSAPWSSTLSSGATYRVRLAEIIYDHATSTPTATDLATWTAADRYSSSATGERFSCAPGRPSLSISPPASVTRGATTMLQPIALAAPTWTSALHFSLASAPTGMSIDEATGEIHWTPGASDVGTRPVIIVLESEGAILDVAGFELPVAAP